VRIEGLGVHSFGRSQEALASQVEQLDSQHVEVLEAGDALDVFEEL
jgi:hypothetical protein